MRQFQQPHAFGEIGLVGGLVVADFAQAAILLVTPLRRHALEEAFFDTAIQLVDIHGVDAALKPLRFGIQARNGGFVLLLLVGVAVAQGSRYPGEDFVTEAEAAQQVGKLRLDHLETLN